MWLATFAASGHVPVPDSVLDPKSPEEAWNVVRLSTENVTRLLNENRLAEIPDQISLCAPALRFLPKASIGSPQSTKQVAVEAMQSSVAITSLAQASVAGDKATVENVIASLRGHLDLLAADYDPRTVKAKIFACPMHPDAVSADPDARCDKCGMGLVERRIPYSFVYVPVGEPSIRLSVSSDQGLVAGQTCRAKVRLMRRDGSPVLVSDLMVMHTQPIHLLIVDPALKDYHHEHPVATGEPGEYAFSFTPALPSSYRIFADLVPTATGIQEFPWTNLSGKVNGEAEASVHGADAFAGRANGRDFLLSIVGTTDGLVRAGRLCVLRISVNESATGNGVTTLEPVMNAFAHLVGFYGDHRTVVHLHPLGAEAANPEARGGPTLEFKFYPPKPGFVRLYCQVQLDGRALYCAFNVTVIP